MNLTMRFLFAAVIIAFLTSCGTNKSDTLLNNNSSFNSGSSKPLASCQQTNSSDISASIATYVDQLGQAQTNQIKLKFNFLSSAITKTGNTVRFYKWKVSQNQAYLDPTALTLIPFNLSSGQTYGTIYTYIDATAITLNTGYAINLNDPQASYQALKIVVNDSSGAIVSQTNLLIPQFLANPADYAYNSDGSARSTLLQALHPLYGKNVSGWTADNFTTYFQNYCF